MNIRLATLEDISQLLPLYIDLGYPTEEKTLERRLKIILTQEQYGLLVAERNEQLIGFVGYSKLFFFETDGTYYRILALVVAESARRQGVATALLDRVKEEAIKEGVEALALNSGLGSSRKAAHDFYRNYGFTQVTAGFALFLDDR